MATMRRQLEQMRHQVDEAPADDEVRQTYNFAPGSIGVVYRAFMTGEGSHGQDLGWEEMKEMKNKKKKICYKLQAMKWGLIPFWTKKPPSYSGMMKTINARDDSLQQDRGIWTTMKRRKRCVVICTGYYEWRKEEGGSKKKVPHYFKRKDGNVMCIAGLWDSVRYEGEGKELYTFTVITTSARDDLTPIHDRMPVILEAGEEINTWLDPTRDAWTKELQSLLKPFSGELEWYEVTTDVNKVGNNSPDFIIPVKDVPKRKGIESFFGSGGKQAEKRKLEDGIAVGKETEEPSKTVKVEESFVMKHH
ncbi:hypothetical protein KEM54_005799 [Ascosphaera aggregata]|nr:hypothetical protein KEM54_005799 [Ascosphaera aggregata]